MVTEKQKQQILELMKFRQGAISEVLVDNAIEMTWATKDEVGTELTAAGYPIAADAALQTARERSLSSAVAAYREQLSKGGTECIIRVLDRTSDGLIKATTRKEFVPWLSDMTQKEATDIIDLISSAEANSVYPKKIARQLSEYFDGTKHNAMTAARTEASKIRNDARVEAMLENGVEYVQYIAVGDERTRPEHDARNGKIYRMEDAPWLGEYNCRCTLAPANYKVKKHGAEVEKSEAVYLTPEQAGVKDE